MKLLILEDRKKRMDQFSTFDIPKAAEAAVVTGQGFVDLIADLQKGDTHALEEFCCISCHQSAISAVVRDNVKNYCKAKKKGLIFFSGGITSSVYVDSSFPYLNINSKDFYSLNLQLFLNDLKVGTEPNLLKIQFGENWKLAMLLTLRNKINLSLNKEILSTKGLYNIQGSEKITLLTHLGINKLIGAEIINGDTQKILSKDEFDKISTDEIGTVLHAINHSITTMV